MNNYLIDTHCHLHDPEWFTPQQQTEFLKLAHQDQVQQLICIGTYPADSAVAEAYARKHPGVYWTYGIHPEFATQYQQMLRDGLSLPESTQILQNSSISPEIISDHSTKSDINDMTSEKSLAKLLTDQLAYATMEVRNEVSALKPQHFDVQPPVELSKMPSFSSILTEVEPAYQSAESSKIPNSSSTSTEGKLVRPPVELSKMPDLLKSARLVAIGEIGLDYHYENYDRSAEIHLFEEMLQLAQTLDLPVSLHIRNAYADVWSVLDNFPEVRGVIHSFTGSKKDLRQALNRDFFIGVNGLITYNTISLPPLEKIVLETDSPFLTPVPFRGTINMPGYVKYVATYLSEKLGVAEEIIREQTTSNARELFQL